MVPPSLRRERIRQTLLELGPLSVECIAQVTELQLKQAVGILQAGRHKWFEIMGSEKVTGKGPTGKRWVYDRAVWGIRAGIALREEAYKALKKWPSWNSK